MNNVVDRSQQTASYPPRRGPQWLASLAPSGAGRALILFLVLAILGATPFLVGSEFGQRALLALLASAVIIPNLVNKPALGMGMLIFFLCLLGGIRRNLIPLIGWAPTDPLILVEALTSGVMFAWLLLRRNVSSDTPLARLMVILLVWMGLEAFNPIEGGIAVSLGGILFTIVPLLWFFYGRAFGTPALVQSVLKTVIAVAILAALYGLYQTWFGFTPGEIIWMNSLVPFTSLYVGGTIRAISFLTSPAEYTEIMSMAVVLLYAAWLKGNKLALLPVPLLALALFLESARSPIINTLIGCTVLWAVQGRSKAAWLPRGALALAVATVGLVWSMNQVQQASVDSKTSDLVKHQAAGITDPGESTLPEHLALFVNGIMDGFRHPLGRGLGAGTPAAARLSGENLTFPEKAHIGGTIQTGMGTEVDISNSFLALGFIGGFLYLIILIRMWRDAFNFWDVDRTWISLCIVGILCVAATQWINGNYYAGTLVVWFCNGAMDRQLQLMPRKRLAGSMPAASSRQTGTVRLNRVPVNAVSAGDGLEGEAAS